MILGIATRHLTLSLFPPPILIQAGESEVLRDEITLLAHKATLAGVQVMHELYEDAVSVKTRRTPHVINVRLFL